MDGRKIANLLQEGYRMPKPQHVDNKLYDNIVLLLFHDGFYRTYLCRFLFELLVSLKIKPSVLHIFALRWRDEIRRSSQLRILLKLVVVNRTWKKFRPNFFQVLFTTTSFSSVLSCEDLLISSFNHLYLLNRRNEGEWNKMCTITSWYLLYKSFALYYNKMDFLDQKGCSLGIGRTVYN